jgi:HAUS augmin-like complex subunit 1
MDSASLDILPTALFSPSKAAQQRAQAQEWHQVDSWLSAKYQGRSVPQFERNDETLKAMMALSAANEKADEERELLWAVQREALNEATASKERDTSLVAVIESGLDARGKVALEVLADIAVKLDAPKIETYAIAESLCEHTQTSQVLAQQLLHLTQLQKTLENELVLLRAQLQELRSPAFQPPLSLQRQTLEWNRNTKQLRAKLTEYSDRLATLQASSTDASLTNVHELVTKEERIVEMEDKIALLSAKIDAYKGLPKDRVAAIQQVKSTEADVAQLKRELDTLFESLVDKR